MLHPLGNGRACFVSMVPRTSPRQPSSGAISATDRIHRVDLHLYRSNSGNVEGKGRGSCREGASQRGSEGQCFVFCFSTNGYVAFLSRRFLSFLAPSFWGLELEEAKFEYANFICNFRMYWLFMTNEMRFWKHCGSNMQGHDYNRAFLNTFTYFFFYMLETTRCFLSQLGNKLPKKNTGVYNNSMA